MNILEKKIARKFRLNCWKSLKLLINIAKSFKKIATSLRVKINDETVIRIKFKYSNDLNKIVG